MGPLAKFLIKLGAIMAVSGIIVMVLNKWEGFEEWRSHWHWGEGKGGDR